LSVTSARYVCFCSFSQRFMLRCYQIFAFASAASSLLKTGD
jgi:hypothetical protein